MFEDLFEDAVREAIPQSEKIAAERELRELMDLTFFDRKENDFIKDFQQLKLLAGKGLAMFGVINRTISLVRTYPCEECQRRVDGEKEIDFEEAEELIYNIEHVWGHVRTACVMAGIFRDPKILEDYGFGLYLLTVPASRRVEYIGSIKQEIEKRHKTAWNIAVFGDEEPKEIVESIEEQGPKEEAEAKETLKHKIMEKFFPDESLEVSLRVGYAITRVYGRG